MGSNFANSYWLDPEKGALTKNKNNIISYQLPPYGSVILYATNKTIPQDLISPPETREVGAKDIQTIENWNINVGSVALKNIPLIDWRNNEKLKYEFTPGMYTASFHLGKIESGKHYFIDFGKVFYTIAVRVNGKDAGKRLFAPYCVEITRLIKSGDNSIEVQLTTNRRNGFIGEAVRGNPNYAQYNGRENTLVPAGLVGPVVLRVL